MGARRRAHSRALEVAVIADNRTMQRGEGMHVNREDEPSFAGGPTFQKVPLVLDAAALAGADAAILGAPMDDYASFRPGARFAPRAIRTAFDAGGPPAAYSLDLGVDPFADLSIVDHGDASVVPGDGARSHDAVRTAVGRIVDAGVLPVVLGGDHSIAYPGIRAIAERNGRGSLAVVQFDAHADTATDIDGVKYSHGSPFRHLVDEGHVPGDRLVQVGLRGYWPGPSEFEWARAAGVRWHRMEEVAEQGIDAVIESVRAEVSGATSLYLSVDVDVLDPAFAPGTGTPEPGGITSYDLLRALRRLVLDHDLAGLEVVEVSPPYDRAHITASVAHRVVLEVLSALALRMRGGRPRAEDPSNAASRRLKT